MKRSFNEAYKRLRNRVRRFSVRSIVDRALQVLHAPTQDRVEELRKAPWLLLLLVKWACQDRMTPTNGPEIPPEVFDSLRQQMWDFPEEIEHGITADRPAHLFMRQLLRPQVDLQRRMTHGFLREAALLSSQPANSRLRLLFTERTGLSLEEFIDLSVATYSAIVKGKRIFAWSWFDPLRASYGSAVDKFIDLVSTDLVGLVKFFRSLPDSTERHISEIFEFPVIKRYPFLRNTAGVACWYAPVFFRGIEGMVHSVLSDCGAEYIQSFSRLFERHVIAEARKTSATFLDEGELRGLVPAGSKVVDGLMSFPGVNVYVESKAGMFDESVMTVGHAQVFRSRTSALQKSVDQAWATSTGLRLRSAASEQVLNANEEFLLVVTNKELSAGRGDRLIGMYGQEETFNTEQGMLPLRHIYFLSIEDFERLIHGFEGGLDLPAFLRRCVERDNDSATSVMYFEQHLDAEDASYSLSELVERALQESQERLRAALEGAET